VTATDDFEEGGVPRGVTPTATQLRRRGYRALPGRAATTLLVVALAAGCAGGYRDTGLVDQPRPGPTSTTPTTTTAAPTTTTTAATADDQVLAADGLRGIATFGEPQDRVAARIRDRFGTPDEDRTWDQQAIQYFGACPGNRHRFLRWGRLFVLFTDGATNYSPGGRWHFFAWYVEDDQATGSLDPATAAGIRVGSTVADLRAAYGSSLRIFNAADTPPSDGFVVGRGDLNGLLSSTSTSGRVTQLSAGHGCGE
jgi:hypothetical protein